jgi:hypothetical protein
MGKVEPRSDLYSLAATMHHLLTGRDPQLEPPFSFPQLRDLSPEVSVKTAEVVMRALDKDIEKRPPSARDMMHALPDPGPEPKASSATGIGAGSAAPIASMRTVVLDRPHSPGASAAGMAPAAPGISRHGATPSAGNVSANPSAPAKPSTPAKPSMTNMPTVVLDRPDRFPAAPPPSSASPPAAAPPSGKMVTPPSLASSTAAGVARMKSLARSARAMAQRAAAKIPAQQSLFAKPPAVSSTAKTRDLGGKAKAAAQAAPVATPSKSESISNNVSSQDARAGSVNASSGKQAGASKSAAPGAFAGASSQSSTATGAKAGQNGAGPVAAQGKAGAWLVAGGSAPRFALMQSRVIVGRSLGGEAPDIDLAALKGIADRVSRRHAEIIRHGTEYFIRDLGSLNGTYITGRGRLGRDQLYKLKDRDQVVFGSAKLEFRKG